MTSQRMAQCFLIYLLFLGMCEREAFLAPRGVVFEEFEIRILLQRFEPKLGESVGNIVQLQRYGSAKDK